MGTINSQSCERGKEDTEGNKSDVNFSIWMLNSQRTSSGMFDRRMHNSSKNFLTGPERGEEHKNVKFHQITDIS